MTVSGAQASGTAVAGAGPMSAGGGSSTSNTPVLAHVPVGSGDANARGSSG